MARNLGAAQPDSLVLGSLKWRPQLACPPGPQSPDGPEGPFQAGCLSGCWLDRGRISASHHVTPPEGSVLPGPQARATEPLPDPGSCHLAASSWVQVTWPGAGGLLRAAFSMEGATLKVESFSQPVCCSGCIRGQKPHSNLYRKSLV